MAGGARPQKLGFSLWVDGRHFQRRWGRQPPASWTPLWVPRGRPWMLRWLEEREARYVGTVRKCWEAVGQTGQARG